MKKLTSMLMILIVSVVFPVFASADVAGVGMMIAFGVLPYVLIAAIIIIAVVIIVKYIRARREK